MCYSDSRNDDGLRVLAVFYSLVVAVLWIPAFVLRGIGRSFKELGAESWPRANGSITNGNVRVIHGWIVDYAVGELEYSYRAASQYYAGRLARQFPDEQAAWDFVDGHRDQTVVIRYKDDRAESSALLESDQQPRWNGTPMLALVAMIRQHWRDELRDPVIPGKRRG
jgi:hypothetical protein